MLLKLSLATLAFRNYYPLAERIMPQPVMNFPFQMMQRLSNYNVSQFVVTLGCGSATRQMINIVTNQDMYRISYIRLRRYARSSD